MYSSKIRVKQFADQKKEVNNTEIPQLKILSKFATYYKHITNLLIYKLDSYNLLTHLQKQIRK